MAEDLVLEAVAILDNNTGLAAETLSFDSVVRHVGCEYERKRTVELEIVMEMEGEIAWVYIPGPTSDIGEGHMPCLPRIAQRFGGKRNGIGGSMMSKRLVLARAQALLKRPSHLA